MLIADCGLRIADCGLASNRGSGDDKIDPQSGIANPQL
jgi:hypothetical protein